MRLVRMNGGLGNQLFQYIFTRYIEEKTGEECIIDDTELFWFTEETRNNPAYNGYQIERIFDIKHKRLSNSFDKDVFDNLVKLSNSPLKDGEKKRGLVSVFNEYGTNLLTVQEGNVYPLECEYPGMTITFPSNQYCENVIDIRGNVYYYGYWINANWFASIADIILNELKFPDIPDINNQMYMSIIKEANEHSVALHVRRGDFVTLGWALDNSVYKSMINQIRHEISKPVFFVFSDDIEWVKSNMLELGLSNDDKIEYVEGNYRETSYIDMQLMKECRGMVFSSSSFSYLASLLNTRKDKIVYQSTGRQIVYYN